MVMENNKNATQNIFIENKKKATVGGTIEVCEMNDDAVTLSTVFGKIVIKGENLKISEFSAVTGDLTVNGDICALYYDEKSKKESVFRRLIK